VWGTIGRVLGNEDLNRAISLILEGKFYARQGIVRYYRGASNRVVFFIGKKFFFSYVAMFFQLL
jgi:hypothetical protein